MRKFTLTELTGLIGRLRLFAYSYYCEVCDKGKPSDMIAVTKDNVPICVCLDCAMQLVAESHSRKRLVTPNGVPLNGAVVKRGRPRKAVKR